MSGGLFCLIMAAIQTVSSMAQPGSYDAVRADSLMRRAWQARTEAVRRLCGNDRRIGRVRSIDTTFGQAQQAYLQRFGRSWDGLGAVSEGRLATDDQSSVAGTLSSERAIEPLCQSQSSFAGALGEYKNSASLALVELGQ